MSKAIMKSILFHSHYYPQASKRPAIKPLPSFTKLTKNQAERIRIVQNPPPTTWELTQLPEGVSEEVPVACGRQRGSLLIRTLEVIQNDGRRFKEPSNWETLANGNRSNYSKWRSNIKVGIFPTVEGCALLAKVLTFTLRRFSTQRPTRRPAQSTSSLPGMALLLRR